MAAAKKDWIAKALPKSSKGKLHKELGVSPKKKIPEKKIIKAEHAKDPKERKRAKLAMTLKGLRK